MGHSKFEWPVLYLLTLMKIEKIDLNTGRVFPMAFIFFGFLLSVAGLWLILTGNSLVGIILLPAALFVLFTNYGVEVDPNHKYFNEYLNIVGVRKDNKIEYSAITNLYIVKTKISQRATSYGGRISTFHDEVYEAYLRFEGYNDRVFLLEDKKKERVFEKLKSLSVQLNISIEDRTNE